MKKLAFVNTWVLMTAILIANQGYGQRKLRKLDSKQLSGQKVLVEDLRSFDRECDLTGGVRVYCPRHRKYNRKLAKTKGKFNSIIAKLEISTKPVSKKTLIEGKYTVDDHRFIIRHGELLEYVNQQLFYLEDRATGIQYHVNLGDSGGMLHVLRKLVRTMNRITKQDRQVE